MLESCFAIGYVSYCTDHTGPYRTGMVFVWYLISRLWTLIVLGRHNISISGHPGTIPSWSSTNTSNQTESLGLALKTVGLKPFVQNPFPKHHMEWEVSTKKEIWFFFFNVWLFLIIIWNSVCSLSSYLMYMIIPPFIIIRLLDKYALN